MRQGNTLCKHRYCLWCTIILKWVKLLIIPFQLPPSPALSPPRPLRAGASASRRLQPCSSLSVSTPSQPSGAEVSRVYISFFISVIAPSIRAPAGQHSLWPRLLSWLSPPVCPHPAPVSHLQEEDRPPGLSPAISLIPTSPIVKYDGKISIENIYLIDFF